MLRAVPIVTTHRSSKSRAACTGAFAFALAVVFTLSPSPAIAQTSARRAFQRGVSALNEGRFADAVTALEESYELQHAPIVLYDLGLSYRALGRYREAADSFERYVEAPERGADARRINTVRDELRRLRAGLGHVTVRITPEHATVRVDARPLEVTSNSLVLDPGDHIFEVSSEGYRTYRREMNVQPGSQTALVIELEPTAWVARLVVQTSVPTAAIYIDEVSVGVGPVERHVPSGDHRVEVHAPGYDVFRRTVHAGLDGMVRVDAHLDVEGHNRWVIPVGVGVGAVIAGAVVLGVVFATSTTDAPYSATWGNTQAIHVR